MFAVLCVPTSFTAIFFVRVGREILRKCIWKFAIGIDIDGRVTGGAGDVQDGRLGHWAFAVNVDVATHEFLLSVHFGDVYWCTLAWPSELQEADRHSDRRACVDFGRSHGVLLEPREKPAMQRTSLLCEV